MISQAKQSAYILLVTFVVGSLFAPASHYAFMMLHDAYDLDGHHVMVSGHHGEMDQATQGKHISRAQGAWMYDAGPSHFICEYAALFATFAATEVTTVASLAAPRLQRILAESPTQAPFVHTLVPFSQRGPPHAS